MSGCLLLSAGCGGHSGPSIDTMTCDQLHAFYGAHVTANLHGYNSFKEKSQAMKDASAVNARIAAIPGGCPGSDNW